MLTLEVLSKGKNINSMCVFEKPTLEVKYDPGAYSNTTADTFSCRQVFVSVCFAVGGSEESNSYLIFGSGTKLYVTNEQVVKPKVKVFSAASSAHSGGRSFLLCQASSMFPPLVQFSWEKRKHPNEKPEPAEGEELVLKDSGGITAIKVLDQQDVHSYEYSCDVKHELETVRPAVFQGIAKPQPPPPPPRWYKERLLCLMYTVLIAKSLVYVCGLSLLRIIKNKEPLTNSTHAD